MSPPRVPKTLAAALLLAVVVTPSLWMFATLPPLWRDVDAYVQTVYPPSPDTILLHGPLYCAVSRIPLWLGYLATGSRPLVSLGHFIDHSQLTDPGVFGLILAQHAALWCGALYLIYACAQTFAARLCLALFFATQPLFYSFAQCVGSETLSLILMLFLAGAGLRLACRYPHIAASDWVGVTALLCCCILTRKINVMLVALLPVTIALLALQHRFRESAVNWRRATQIWFLCITTSIIALLWATTLTHLLCWRAHIPWRPKFGYTFIWRLDFLQPMPSTARQELLKKTAAKCRRVDARQLISFLGDWLDEHEGWEAAQFARDAHSAFYSWQKQNADANFDLALDEIARAFLIPTVAPLQSAALRDFRFAARRGETEIIEGLFSSTDYFFAHKGQLPQYAHLRTFSMPREQLLYLGTRSYLRWWSFLSFRAWLGVALLLLMVGLLLNATIASGTNTPAIIFAICIGIVGTVMLLLNCFFAAFIDRFMLPMIESLLIAILILLGAILQRPRSSAPA